MVDLLLAAAEHPAAPAELRVTALRALAAHRDGFATQAAVTHPDVPLDVARDVCTREEPLWLARPDVTVDDAVAHVTGGPVTAAVGALNRYRGPGLAAVCTAALAAHPASLRVAKAVVRLGATVDLDAQTASVAALRAAGRGYLTTNERDDVVALVAARYRARDRGAVDLADSVAAVAVDYRLQERLTALAAALHDRPATGAPGWLTHPDTTPGQALEWAKATRRAMAWRRTVAAHPVPQVLDAALDHFGSVTVARAVVQAGAPWHPAQVLRAMPLLDPDALTEFQQWALRHALRLVPAAAAAAFVTEHGATHGVDGLCQRTIVDPGEIEALHDAVRRAFPRPPLANVGLRDWVRLVLVHPATPQRLRDAVAGDAAWFEAACGADPAWAERARLAAEVGPHLGEQVPLPELLSRRFGPGASALLDDALGRHLPRLTGPEAATGFCAIGPSFTGSLRDLVDVCAAIGA